MSYSLNWDLDPIYPGGIESPEFAAKLTLLDQQIKQFASDVTATTVSQTRTSASSSLW